MPDHNDDSSIPMLTDVLMQGKPPHEQDDEKKAAAGGDAGADDASIPMLTDVLSAGAAQWASGVPQPEAPAGAAGNAPAEETHDDVIPVLTEMLTPGPSVIARGAAPPGAPASPVDASQAALPTEPVGHTAAGPSGYREPAEAAPETGPSEVHDDDIPVLTDRIAPHVDEPVRSAAPPEAPVDTTAAERRIMPPEPPSAESSEAKAIEAAAGGAQDAPLAQAHADDIPVLTDRVAPALAEPARSAAPPEVPFVPIEAHTGASLAAAGGAAGLSDAMLPRTEAAGGVPGGEAVVPAQARADAEAPPALAHADTVAPHPQAHAVEEEAVAAGTDSSHHALRSHHAKPHAHTAEPRDEHAEPDAHHPESHGPEHPRAKPHRAAAQSRHHHAADSTALDADLIAEQLRGRFANYLTGEGRHVIEVRCRDVLREHTSWLVNQITREVALALELEISRWVRDAVRDEIAKRKHLA